MHVKTILVPTDFSENAQIAFDRAYDLACQLGAKLYLLYVQEESALRIAVKEGGLQEDSTDESVQAFVQQLTQTRFSQMLAGRGPTECPIERLTRRGDADAVIVEVARELNAGMIAVGMRGVTAMNAIVSAVLGSVADSVVRKSPCPVLVVRPEHTK